MKISRAVREMDLKGRQGWHILTVAESGFSALSHYVESEFGLDPMIGAEFADRINQQDEPGSLYPKAPISAIPCRYFREQADSEDPAVMEDFKRHISEFIEMNQTHIKASQILVNFGVCHDPVPLRYIKATEEVFRDSAGNGIIKELVIFKRALIAHEESKMIRERTFNINPDRQTEFEWVSLEEGIEVYPDSGDNFMIPWADFSRCLYQAQKMARGTNRVKLGNHMNTPSPGGLGEWLKANKNLFRSLTNRRLSQLGPILRRMGIIDYENEGNSVVWVFRKE